MGKKITKEQQQLLIIGGIALVIVIWLYRRKKSKTEQAEISASTSSSGVVSSVSSGTTIPDWQKRYNALPSLGESGILKRGVKAKEVWTLQHLYNENIVPREGKATILVDGIFGSETEKAVKYVLENKFNYTMLQNWRKWVLMNQRERIHQLNS